jgi:RDD family
MRRATAQPQARVRRGALSAMIAGVVCVLLGSAQAAEAPVAVREVGSGRYVLASGAPAGSTQGVVVGAAPVVPPAESHAWCVVPDASGTAVVMHFPPRRFASVEDGKLHGSEDGTVRVAGRCNLAPTAVAAWGDRLYLLEDRPRGFESTKRLISSLRAVRSGVGDWWATAPGTGLESHPSLSGEGELISMVGTSLGLAVLLEDRDPQTDRRVLRVRLLADRAWVDIAVPADASALMADGLAVRGEARAWVTLISSLDAIDLVCQSKDGLFRWRVACDTEFALRVRQSSNVDRPYDFEAEGDQASSRGRPGGQGATVEPTKAVEVDWRPREQLGGSDGAGASLVGPEPDFVGLVNGRLALVDRSGSMIHLKEWTGIRWQLIGSFDAPEGLGALGVMPLEGVGRLAFVWPEGEDAAQASAKAALGQELRHHVTEVSVFTGRELFEGRWRLDSPLEVSDFRVLAFVLMGAMSLVIVFVLRSESVSAEATLPADAAFAGPVMRSVATIIDFAVAFLIAAKVCGLGVTEVFSVEALLHGDGVLALAAALGIASVIGSVSEAVFGRTLGKLVAGCEVVDSRAGAAPVEAERDMKPRPWSAVVRNVLKWWLPPIGVMALLDAQGRHPGDRLAKTAVVVWLDEPEE